MSTQSNPVQDSCKLSIVRNGLIVELQLIGTNETIIDTLTDVLIKHKDLRMMIELALIRSLIEQHIK